MLRKIFANTEISIPALDKLPKQEGWTSGDLRNIILWIFGIAGLVAVGIIVYGGIKYQTAQGDPNKVKQASQIITYAIVGLVVVLLASAITVFATGLVGDALK